MSYSGTNGRNKTRKYNFRQKVVTGGPGPPGPTPKSALVMESSYTVLIVSLDRHRKLFKGAMPLSKVRVKQSLPGIKCTNCYMQQN